MAKDKIPFEDFLMEVDPAQQGFVMQLNDYLTAKGCILKIQTAKSGFVVSYADDKTKKVLINYVFRKKGMLVRIYGDHINQYQEYLDTLNDTMFKEVDKASICRRLADPTKCNARCPMGYTFAMRGNDYIKCRYGSFMFLVNNQSQALIRGFIEKELERRTA